MSDDEYITKSGKRLTDEDIEALADEAERGYDINDLKRGQIAPPHRPERVCTLCQEPLLLGENYVPRQWMHQECALRSALGGVGHLLAHVYWCLERNDPDAGLTFRQSAIMVDHLVTILGVEGALELR